ncbi:hypothetical protein DYBT9623_00684 [Dyadobacter sp. CECT 9623]|uniref:Collagen triple helix repeat protein n=1 Tax=Dyadobacter linearis TaxID=2823330 RepID=A0ABM8UKF4_9BACT|nr:collagen-like protein [Dyadobacter sp. CECT 9623]CAG5067956.1 hypothetical protein DYBT9623_00684 [Dyadobacter sp. CECT 9623]
MRFYSNFSGERIRLIIHTGRKGDTGPKGDQGLQGAQGIQGIQGLKGEKGDTGASGQTGPVGAAGSAGLKGDKGDKGDQGLQGVQGAAGQTGAAGAKGEKGDKGDTGAQGIQGATGATGAQGAAGATGETGPRGLKGDQGLQGVQGPVGAQGTQGIKGDTGLKGDKGDTGSTGAAGAVGAKGDKGDTGETGAAGAKGDTGPAGATGVAGPAGETGPRGLKGDKGDTGLQGIQGPVGPTGEKGAKGDQGVQGIQGHLGPVGPTGPGGAQGVKGDKGDKGDAGELTQEFIQLSENIFIARDQALASTNNVLTISQLKTKYNPLFKSAFISDGDLSGNFVIDNDTNASVDDHFVISDASGNKWVRQIEYYVEAKKFPSVGTESAFFAFIERIGSTPCTIILNRQIPITTNRIIPANIEIQAKPTGSFNISTGTTLTLEGPLSAGYYQIFYGQGLVTTFAVNLNIMWFGAVRDGVTDNQPMFDRAVRSIASNLGNLNPIKITNELIVPTGTYAIGSELKIPVTVRPRIEGLAIFWGINNAEPTLTLCSDLSVPLFYKDMFNAGRLIEGSLLILNKSFFTSPNNSLNTSSSIPRSNVPLGSIGIRIGNSPAISNRLMARYDVDNIRVAGYDFGCDWIPSNNYMCKFKNWHMEGNNNHVRVYSTSGGGSNSGEQSGFHHCRFAGAEKVFLLQADAYDFLAHDCHFDFVKIVVFMDTMFRGFNGIKFSKCYFESVTEHFVYSVANGNPYKAPTIDFDGCTGLNGRRERFFNTNASKGYVLNIDRFADRIDSGADESDGREAWNSQDPDRFMLINPASPSIGIRKKDFFQDLHIPPIVQNNIDQVYFFWNFKNIETIGALASTNPYVDATGSTNVASYEIASTDRGNALKIVAESGTQATFVSKARQLTEVKFGDVFAFNLIYKVIPETTDNVLSPRFSVEMLNEHKELLSTTTPQTNNDKSTPDIWRCGRWGQEIRITNPEVRFIRLCFQINGLGGTIYIETIVIDKR